jgi:hypothetical protein
VPTLVHPRPTADVVERAAARLATYWDVPATARAELLTGVAELVNAMNAAIDDGYDGVASPDDHPALLLRQFAHARRRLR